MGIIDDIENANGYSIFPKKQIKERLKDLDAYSGLSKKEIEEVEKVAYPNKKEKSDYYKDIVIDREIISNLANVELLEEMKNYKFDLPLAFGFALLSINKWNYYGSAKVRRIDAGVKTLQFSQQNINTLIRNR